MRTRPAAVAARSGRAWPRLPRGRCERCAGRVERAGRAGIGRSPNGRDGAGRFPNRQGWSDRSRTARAGLIDLRTARGGLGQPADDVGETGEAAAYLDAVDLLGRAVQVARLLVRAVGGHQRPAATELGGRGESGRDRAGGCAAERCGTGSWWPAHRPRADRPPLTWCRPPW